MCPPRGCAQFATPGDESVVIEAAPVSCVPAEGSMSVTITSVPIVGTVPSGERGGRL